MLISVRAFTLILCTAAHSRLSALMAIDGAPSARLPESEAGLDGAPSARSLIPNDRVALMDDHDDYDDG